MAQLEKKKMAQSIYNRSMAITLKYTLLQNKLTAVAEQPSYSEKKGAELCWSRLHWCRHQVLPFPSLDHSLSPSHRPLSLFLSSSFFSRSATWQPFFPICFLSLFFIFNLVHTAGNLRVGRNPPSLAGTAGTGRKVWRYGISALVYRNPSKMAGTERDSQPWSQALFHLAFTEPFKVVTVEIKSPCTLILLFSSHVQLLSYEKISNFSLE